MFKSNLIRPCLTKLMCCLNWTSWICSQWDLFWAILCRGRRMRKPTSPTHRANRPATGSGFFRWQSWVIPTASNGPMAKLSPHVWTIRNHQKSPGSSDSTSSSAGPGQKRMRSRCQWSMFIEFYCRYTASQNIDMY